MSFRLFIYYCALCGGWAAFLTWGLRPGHRPGQPAAGRRLHGDPDRRHPRRFVAAAIGFVDAVLNAAGTQRLVRVLVCAVLGLLRRGVRRLRRPSCLNNHLGVPIVVGWMLAGVLIGAGIGGVRHHPGGQVRRGRPSRRMRKSLNGVYGGLIGGLHRRAAVLAARGSSTALPRSGQLIGLVLLGVCIGLMIGLAQVVLKEAWVKVEEGFRAGREIMLTKDETTIGRAETLRPRPVRRQQHREAARHASCMKNNRYLLAHVGEARRDAAQRPARRRQARAAARGRPDPHRQERPELRRAAEEEEAMRTVKRLPERLRRASGWNSRRDGTEPGERRMPYVINCPHCKNADADGRRRRRQAVPLPVLQEPLRRPRPPPSAPAPPPRRRAAPPSRPAAAPPARRPAAAARPRPAAPARRDARRPARPAAPSCSKGPSAAWTAAT